MMRPRLPLAIALLAIALVAPCRAQEPGVARSEPRAGLPIGPLLPGDHWAVRAAARLDLLGVIDHPHLPAQRAVPLDVVERALRAAAAAEGHDPIIAAYAHDLYERLSEEYRGLADSPDRLSVIGARAGAGLRARRGAVAPGSGEFEPHRSGAEPLADRSEALLLGELSARWGDRVVVSAAPRLGARGAEVERLELTGVLGPWALSVGRIPVGYAHGRSGAVVLGATAEMDAVQLETRLPLRLPWVLGYLGPVSFNTFFARMWEERHPGDPYFWGASGQFRPHRRLTMGVHRAALFGGSHPEDQPVTFQRLVDMLIGRVAGVGFENQVVSVSARLILPTERLVPLTAYIEWGAEDAAGALRDVPGIVAGVTAPGLPGLPQLSLGAEHTRFGTSCCGNPEWYRHWSFHGSWASRDVALGHPLGGNGTELSGFATADLHGGRVRLDSRAFLRDRGEQNLFVPGREGRSRGGALELEWQPAGSFLIRAEAAREWGSGWTGSSARAAAVYNF